ncbi:hypothetical protein [Vibrio halioticoli]|nr:hypothetical protein [Vibrio halioticoli]
MYKTMSVMLLFPTSIMAGEVDNYYAWGKTIKNSEAVFNDYLNQHIESSLQQLSNKQQSLTCEQVALVVMKDLGATRYPLKHRGALNTDMELWAQQSELVDRQPDDNTSLDEYAQHSIYSPVMRTAGVKTDLDHVVNVAGVYFGTDKISHFLGSGYEYYARYLKAIQKDSQEFSQAKSIIWATKMEGGLLGIKVVGVYSYADLEANYQGFEMARDLCRLQHIENAGGWSFSQPVDMRKYVNPNWDESFYLSTYSDSRAKKVKQNMQLHEGVCENRQQLWVKQQRQFYLQWESGYPPFDQETLNSSFSTYLLTLAQHYAHQESYENDSSLKAHLKTLSLTMEEFNYFIREAKVPQQQGFSLQELCS